MRNLTRTWPPPHGTNTALPPFAVVNFPLTLAWDSRGARVIYDLYESTNLVDWTIITNTTNCVITVEADKPWSFFKVDDRWDLLTGALR